MPTAVIRMTAAAKPGDLARLRSAYFRSCMAGNLKR
jgi:hypothetical protein